MKVNLFCAMIVSEHSAKNTVYICNMKIEG